MDDVLSRLHAALAGRYKIERELGRGGMATVYLARDLKHHRPVAIKVLRPELAAALGPDRFLREIETAAGLNHPHILPVHDSSEAGGFLYYVMPYVEGESLRNRLTREKQLPIDDALKITREVADALSYAHRRDVVHRDIKPENILLESGHAIVADFGIARAITAARDERLTGTGIAVGTPPYMSPEQAAAESKIDGRTDVYSLGCVLYEMLVGEPPFTGPSLRAVPARHSADPVPRARALRDTVPETVEQAIAKALAKLPADRYDTAAEFAAALSASRLPNTERRTRARRRRWRLALAGGAVVLSVAGLAVILVPPAQRALALTLLTRKGATLHPQRFVVAPFDNETGDSALLALGNMAADWIAQGLVRTGAVEVVDARTAFITSKIVGATPRLLRTGNRARALAEETGARTVVSGSYYREGDSLLFLAQIIDAASGRLIRAVDPVKGHARAPSEIVERLRQRTMAALAPLMDTTNRSMVYFSSPPSYEAYQEVMRAIEAYLGHRDATAALAHLANATEIDSLYMTPVVFLAQLRFRLGQFDLADSLIRRAERYREHLTPLDRATLEFAKARSRGDPSELLSAARNLVRASPGSTEMQGFVAEIAVKTNRPHEALGALAQLDPDRGINLVSPTYWVFRASAHHELGDFRAELQDARRGQRRFGDRDGLRAAEVRALAGLGKVASVAKLVTGSSDPSVEDLAIRELRGHGYREESLQLAERYVADLQTGKPDTSVGARLRLGTAFYLAERWREAHDVFDGLAARDTNDLTYQGYLGVLAARRGDRSEAQRIAQWFAKLTGPYLYGEPAYWQARIVALLGDKEQAVTLLRSAFSQGYQVRYGMDFIPYAHADMDFESLLDYPLFQELVRPRG